MRISFVSDYRSPIARQWIDGVAAHGHQVHVVSSRPLSASSSDCAGYPIEVEPLGPVALAQFWTSRRPRTLRTTDTTAGADWSARLPGAQALLRHLTPLELRLHRRNLREKLAKFKPDLVHAMRLPYEGIAAAQTWTGGPLLASIWGNDLTLHAARSGPIGRATRIALGRLAGLHTDCHRDRDLAVRWGFDPRKPAIVLPGSGGVRTDHFRPGPSNLRDALGIPPTAPVILNPRGVRAYVHIPEFLRSLPIILGQRHDVHVVCTGMRGNQAIHKEVERIPGKDRIHLLPVVSHSEMADVYRAADVSLSLTSHDGTPNSLLEALASGCFPVVGPVEAVLEWVTDGVNGLVVSPTDPEAIAATVLFALTAKDLRLRAQEINTLLVRERASLGSCITAATTFYDRLIEASRTRRRAQCT